MKLKITGVFQVLLTALLIIYSQYDMFSQIADATKAKPPGLSVLFVGFSLGPSQSNIINEGTLSVSGLTSKKMNSLTGSAEIGYFFTEHIGLSSGISFDSYKTRLALSAYQNKFNTIDSEKEAYERRVSGSDITEVQEAGYIGIPICLNIRLPLNKSTGFFLQPGFNLAFPVSKKYSSSGTFTYKGYYPAYNVLLENLPNYGFPVNHSTTANGQLELKPVNINAVASAGFYCTVQKKITIAIAAFFNRSLSGISAYSKSGEFQLSSDVDQVNSLMGGCSNVSYNSIGVKISVRYFLK
jgi:hypothetical protein